MTRSLKSYVAIWFCLLVIVVLPTLVSGQDSNVSAEAQIRANLRASTDVNSALLGEIVTGTRYPVIGRSEFYPWVLLGDPSTSQPIGWVFQDLVTIYGNVNSVPFSTMTIGTVPAITIQPSTTLASTETFQLQGVALPT